MAKEQLDALTGLRFVAAFAIVWLHADLYFEWATSGHALPLVQGVSFFFVLSGFILAHVYSERKFTASSFMKARIARLWPLHIACLLAVVFFIQSDSQAFDGPGLFSKWYSFGVNAVLLQSWVPTTSYMFSWNSVSWSISTEMFFYAMFPLLLPLLKRNALAVLAIGILPIVVLAFAIPMLAIPREGGFFDVTTVPLLYSFPPSRLMEFCVGMAAYRVWANIRPSMPVAVVPSALIEMGALAAVSAWFAGSDYVADLFVWSRATAGWYSNGGACFAFAALIVVFSSSRGPISKLLGSFVMVKLGEISFAIYMTHQIVMKVIKLSYPEFGNNPAIVLAAVMIAGIVGHYCIEKPAQRLLLGLRRPRDLAEPAAA